MPLFLSLNDLLYHVKNYVWICVILQLINNCLIKSCRPIFFSINHQRGRHFYYKLHLVHPRGCGYGYSSTKLWSKWRVPKVRIHKAFLVFFLLSEVMRLLIFLISLSYLLFYIVAPHEIIEFQVSIHENTQKFLFSTLHCFYFPNVGKHVSCLCPNLRK